MWGVVHKRIGKPHDKLLPLNRDNDFLQSATALSISTVTSAACLYHKQFRSHLELQKIQGSDARNVYDLLLLVLGGRRVIRPRTSSDPECNVHEAFEAVCEACKVLTAS